MTTTNAVATNGKQTSTPPPQVAIVEKSIADNVLQKIKVFQETNTLNVPKDYSAPNALRAAWLILQETKNMDKRPVLEVCTRESVANALLKMVTQGLNPVKKQCSFIAYGNTLTCQREYAGTIAIAKRDAGVVKVSANVVYSGDEFAYEINPETLDKKITKHEQTLESLGGADIKGAYAIVEYKDGSRKTEIMAMAQVRKAWEQGPTKGQSPAHKNFPDQMCMKTVINRALKIDVNSSDDSALFEDDMPADDQKVANVKQEIADNANMKEIGFEESTTDQNSNVDTETGEVKDETTPAQQSTITGPGF
jgi:recombination protein RecT